MKLTKEEKRKKLIALRKKALEANLPLKEGATNLVFGEGNVDTDVLFIGEGPGHWEDVKARPFVGNAGALLNQMLQIIDLDRKDVFITNMIMYRPPENRDPEPDEIKAFEVYLDGIIDTIDPRVIVTLGRFSMGKFMPGVYISNVHGKPKEISWKGNTKVVIPMYHPAAALRNGEVKRKLKTDFEIIPQILSDLKEKENVDDKMEDKESEQMSLV
jgi:uracil-DNA glycosylase family 4